jgi:hypothetical protein
MHAILILFRIAGASPRLRTQHAWQEQADDEVSGH